MWDKQLLIHVHLEDGFYLRRSGSVLEQGGSARLSPILLPQDALWFGQLWDGFEEKLWAKEV